MGHDLENIRRDLSHVYWIGGSSRGGKTTVARALGKEFDFSIYHHDEKWLNGEHTSKADPERHPTMFHYRHLYNFYKSRSALIEAFMSMGPVEHLIEDQFKFWVEEFEMVIDDLYEMPRDKPIVAEGMGLLPEQICQVATPHKSVCLLAAEAAEQEMIRKHPDGSEPWFGKFVEWRALFTERMIAQAERFGVRITEAAGVRSIEDTYAQIKNVFGLFV
ncbi:MAG: hypothetical protein O2954_00360 [bacterium]|nr:hypothetical protein [bacterium]